MLDGRVILLGRKQRQVAKIARKDKVSFSCAMLGGLVEIQVEVSRELLQS